MKTERLYVITRKDLQRGLKMAQVCHVSLESPKRLSFDKRKIPYLIVLEVENEERLTLLEEQAREKTIVVSFQEPDLNNQLTAIAFLGDDRTRSLTEGLRLAG